MEIKLRTTAPIPLMPPLFLLLLLLLLRRPHRRLTAHSSSSSAAAAASSSSSSPSSAVRLEQLVSAERSGQVSRTFSKLDSMHNLLSGSRASLTLAPLRPTLQGVCVCVCLTCFTYLVCVSVYRCVTHIGAPRFKYLVCVRVSLTLAPLRPALPGSSL